MAVSDQIIAVFDALCEKLGVAVDWTQQNVLPYLQDVSLRYVRYELAWSIFTVLETLFAFIAIALFARFCVRKARVEMESTDRKLWWGMASVIAVALLCCCVIARLDGIENAVRTIIACLTIPESVVINGLSQFAGAL